MKASFLVLIFRSLVFHNAIFVQPAFIFISDYRSNAICIINKAEVKQHKML